MFKWFTKSTNLNDQNDITTQIPSLILINNGFKSFMENGSWIIYFITFIMLSLGIYYFHLDINHRKAVLQRRREIRRANERPPQKRRPGAAARDHEIYRNIMGNVQKYINPEEFVFRQTRSGTIYGQYVDENSKEIKTNPSDVIDNKDDDIVAT